MSTRSNDEEKPEDDEEKQRQAALRRLGAHLLKDAHSRGISVCGWQITAKKLPILNMQSVERWEQLLGTSHLPEMVFGDSALELVHKASGICIHFNALDALRSWKEEGLPPVEVPAAAKWKMRSKPSEEIVLDYDYTFTTSYSGSESFACSTDSQAEGLKLEWSETEDHIDLVSLQARDPIVFYDEVVLYEDELADNGVSLLTVKVRVMPSCWFLLLRFWLRVDGVLMRLRDTRMYSSFQQDASAFPTVLRERSIREGKVQDLLARGPLPDMLADTDGSLVYDKLKICKQYTETLAAIRVR
ncbi:hypothetical protein GOP47_0000246 [Adiantum capillus-veneris]|uniref:TIP41-like protein n=1 Tax=Adiantum capillus-veneris TaxID=13818 RepID=A0A9D4VD77_ADICA|nr:hypothetical protein GOP47_0000246 [Adiantum capillus-veneris]